MNKEFSNIIIFNNKDISYIKEKIEKVFTELEYESADKDEYDKKIVILHDKINNICVLSSSLLSFESSDTNKSIIRKIAKRVAQDTFMITATGNLATLEKYSFNKRTYDYIAFGENLKELGFVEPYTHKEIWKNHFVGRNTIDDVEKIMSQEKTFFNYYEIVLEIVKLYGIRIEIATYADNINTNLPADIQKEIVYLKLKK